MSKEEIKDVLDLLDGETLRMLSRGMYWYGRAVENFGANANTPIEIRDLSEVIYQAIQDKE